MKGMNKREEENRQKKKAPPFEKIQIESAPKIKDRRPIKGAIKKGEPMNYLGVDCHKRKSFLTAMDSGGSDNEMLAGYMDLLDFLADKIKIADKRIKEIIKE